MPTPMSPDDIALILDAIHKLDCALVEVTVGDVRIVVRRGPAAEMPQAAAAPAAFAASSVAQAGGGPAQPAALHPPEAQPRAVAREQTGSPSATQPASSAQDVAVWLEREAQGRAVVMRAPMIGTFYRAKAPGEPPFVEVDSPVSTGDTVGLIEAMKLFNSMIADCDGKVAAIFAANGELVEYEQPVLALWKQ